MGTIYVDYEVNERDLVLIAGSQGAKYFSREVWGDDMKFARGEEDETGSEIARHRVTGIPEGQKERIGFAFHIDMVPVDGWKNCPQCVEKGSEKNGVGLGSDHCLCRGRGVVGRYCNEDGDRTSDGIVSDKCQNGYVLEDS